jgi:hypothetical protein
MGFINRSDVSLVDGTSLLGQVNSRKLPNLNAAASAPFQVGSKQKSLRFLSGKLYIRHLKIALSDVSFIQCDAWRPH